ncbi:MAG: thermostable hemolysin [Gammaproteobacteria bacterium]|nr:MAG: thermostable hemolysin [Gammaproteobacteria bacterium]
MMNSGLYNITPPAPQAAHNCRLALSPASDPKREELTRYIHTQFARHYGADVHSFLPWLVGLYKDEAVAAVAGIRFARDEQLYLEHYLDEPIEAAIAHIPGLAVHRHEIAEIGNLAGTVRSCVRELFVALACLTQAAGMKVVTCTANPAVRAVFREMKMPFKPVCTAVPSRLGKGASQWGSYYARTCVIMAVNIDDVIDAMARHYPDILGRAVPAAQELIQREHLVPANPVTH